MMSSPTPMHGEDPAWDRFVAGHRAAPVEQTSLWGGVQSLRGWHAHRVIVTRDGAPTGGFQCLVRKTRRVGAIGYVHHGPLRDPDAGPAMEDLVAALLRFARAQRLAYLAVVPAYFDHDASPAYLNRGFFQGPPPYPPSTPMRATVVLDLAPSLEELLARMRATTRNLIRAGLKRGLVAREGGLADVSTFGNLMTALCARRGTRPNVPTGDYLKELWIRFSAAGNAKLLMVDHAEQPVAALMLFRLGDWCRAWRVGWSGEHSEKRPNELLYWQAIRWAKEQGCRHFDFFGFDTRLATRILTDPLKEGEDPARICGMSSFKLGFGGTVLPPLPRYCHLPNPFLAWLARSVAPPLLRFGMTRRLLKLG